MSEFGRSLIASANEAFAIAKGEAEPARVYRLIQTDVAAVRARLGLTQREFAATFGFRLTDVCDWEQKRRRPDRIAANLLRVIDHAPDVVREALAS